MKPGDRVRVLPSCRSLVAPKGMPGHLDHKADSEGSPVTCDRETAGTFLDGAWIVRLDNRDLALLWEDEFEVTV